MINMSPFKKSLGFASVIALASIIPNKDAVSVKDEDEGSKKTLSPSLQKPSSNKGNVKASRASSPEIPWWERLSARKEKPTLTASSNVKPSKTKNGTLEVIQPVPISRNPVNLEVNQPQNSKPGSIDNLISTSSTIEDKDEQPAKAPHEVKLSPEEILQRQEEKKALVKRLTDELISKAHHKSGLTLTDEQDYQFGLFLWFDDSNKKQGNTEAWKAYMKLLREVLGEAQYNVGLHIAKDDIDKGLKWFKKAIRNGYPQAQQSFDEFKLKTNNDVEKWVDELKQAGAPLNITFKQVEPTEDEVSPYSDAQWQTPGFLRKHSHMRQEEEMIKVYDKDKNKDWPFMGFLFSRFLDRSNQCAPTKAVVVWQVYPRQISLEYSSPVVTAFSDIIGKEIPLYFNYHGNRIPESQGLDPHLTRHIPRYLETILRPMEYYLYSGPYADLLMSPLGHKYKENL